MLNRMRPIRPGPIRSDPTATNQCELAMPTIIGATYLIIIEWKVCKRQTTRIYILTSCRILTKQVAI